MRSSSSLLYSLCLVFSFDLAYAATSLANTTFTSSSTESSSIESISTTKTLTSTASARNLTVSSIASSTTIPATSTAVVVSSSAAPSPMSTSVTAPHSSSAVKSSTTKPPSAVMSPPPPPGLPPATNQTMSSSSDPLTKSSTHSTPPPSTVEASPSKTNTTTIKSNPSPSPSPSPSPISHSSTSSIPVPGPPPSQAPPPPSSSSSTSRSNATSIHTTAATTTSVVVVHVPNSSISLSTITTQADSTFSTPVAVTSTEANGAKIITTPPLITVISTSTESNGAAATFTHVIANPNFTGNNQDLASNGGFFHKRGAVAGVFVAIGIAAAALVVALIFCVRRKRRINRRRRWLEGMQQQRPPSFARDPFRDPVFDQEQKVQPLGQSIVSPQEDVRWDRGRSNFLLSDGQTPRQYSNGNFPQASFTLYPDPHPITNMVASDSVGERHNIGLVHAMQTLDRARFRHSYTPSTPSVYPATLAPDEDIHRPADEEAFKPMQRESLIPAPPRPPRSHLRESAKNLTSYAPPTPPASNSSISHANDSSPPSPISSEHRQDLFTRRTLLDVRNQQVMKGVAI